MGQEVKWKGLFVCYSYFKTASFTKDTKNEWCIYFVCCYNCIDRCSMTVRGLSVKHSPLPTEYWGWVWSGKKSESTCAGGLWVSSVFDKQTATRQQWLISHLHKWISHTDRHSHTYRKLSCLHPCFQTPKNTWKKRISIVCGLYNSNDCFIDIFELYVR